MENERMKLLVEKATAGDKQALEKVILSVKDLVYNLSLKMLLFREDGKDATQEILIKLVTNLGSFRNESTFQTWAYRVASNYLLTEKSKKSEAFALPFDQYANMLDSGHSDSISYTSNLGEQKLLEEEVKVSCTHGLLLCLNPQSRIVYILGELLEFNSQEAGEILAIQPENFRKVLSRSRKQIRNFLEKRCGLMNPANPCRCKKKVDFLIDRKAIDPANLQFAQHTNRSIDLINQIDSLERSAAIYRSTPPFSAPDEVMQKMRLTLDLMKK